MKKEWRKKTIQELLEISYELTKRKGITKGVAQNLAAKIEADLLEIKPLHPYTAAVLRYINPLVPFMKGAKSVDAKLVHSADEVIGWVK